MKLKTLGSIYQALSYKKILNSQDDLNDILDNSTALVEPHASNSPSPIYGTLLTFGRDGDGVTQIFGGFNGSLYYRTRAGVTIGWLPWKRVTAVEINGGGLDSILLRLALRSLMVPADESEGKEYRSGAGKRRHTFCERPNNRERICRTDSFVCRIVRSVFGRLQSLANSIFFGSVNSDQDLCTKSRNERLGDDKRNLSSFGGALYV